ncbi:hypothetical protein [Acinetobacter bereziniae]|uniref:hypothetical protein n=1 Tax=Acinetobacter bereziniae TaxID=106648 RepID=UPI002091D531|nr:hypothetical protein [Acinetobacter bereziniae]
MNDIDLIKFISMIFTPIIAFFLGILAIPFIEHNKLKFEQRKLRKIFISELNDEIEAIPSIVKNIFQFIDDTKFYLHSKENKGFHIVFPPEINLYSLNKILDGHYNSFSYEERHSLKALIRLIEYLNEFSRKIKDNFHDVFKIDNIDNKEIGQYLQYNKDYLYALLSYKYQITYLTFSLQKKNSNLKFFRDISNDEAVKFQLKSLKMENRIPELVR